MIDRATGCFAGFLIGDNLGALVEFLTPEVIFDIYPKGEFEIKSGGVWNLLAGQPTDDGEMGLALAHSIVELGHYSVNAAKLGYLEWIDSEPFDCGLTISQGLRFSPNHESQANGAMMRATPLGIYMAGAALEDIIHVARLDAELTHPNILCQDLNAVFVAMIAYAIESKRDASELIEYARTVAAQLSSADEISTLISSCIENPPFDYVHQKGWVKIAFGNVIWQLSYSHNLRDALNNTIRRGGDTDTNAAICGAVFGALYGTSFIPTKWMEALENCRPAYGDPNCHHPRPEAYWPVDYADLARKLLDLKA